MGFGCLQRRRFGKPVRFAAIELSGLVKHSHAGYLLAALSCAFLQTVTAADPVCGEVASVAQLLAKPAAYDGKTVWVVAQVTIDFENMTACPANAQTGTQRCLWLDLDEGPHKTDRDYARYESKLRAWQPFNLQTVAVRARFDKTLKGHLGLWPAGLTNIVEVAGHEAGWNFSANAAVPRTACVARLPAPIDSAGRRIALGNLKLRNGDSDGAMVDFTRAIDFEPGNSRHYLMRGNARRLKRDYAGAIADLTHAIELERHHPDVMYAARAGVKELSGDLDGAITDITRAIEIDPKFDGAWRSRAAVKQKAGDAIGAAGDLARAEALAPVQRSR